jgi:hypothetical protein
VGDGALRRGCRIFLGKGAVKHVIQQCRLVFVANADVDESLAELKLFYPHESVHSTPIGLFSAR